MATRPKKMPPKAAPADYVPIPDLPSSQERLIGRFAVEWAKLEAVLDDLIWQFLGLPLELGRQVTPRFGADAKISVLRAISAVCYDLSTYDFLLWSYLKELLDEANILREDRNLIIHGTWGRAHPRYIPNVMSLRVKDTPSTVVGEDFPAERMRATIRAVYVVKRRLLTLYGSARSSHRKALERYPED